MAHGGHLATSGPSAHSDMDHLKTGLSEATASFVAANCSPFTNPDDLICDGARVPDPSTTQRTCSTTLYTSLQIPVVPDIWNEFFTGPSAVALNGRQFVVVNANPLGGFVPIQWCMRDKPNFTAGTNADLTYFNYGVTDTAPTEASRTDPLSWAKLYDGFNQGDLISKIHALSCASARHRIVGCAVKVNLGTDTTINRGQIEIGQFEIADTRTAGNVIITRNNTPTANGYWFGWDVGAAASPANASSNMGMYSSRMYTCDYMSTKNSIMNARNQNRGFLRAEDGATVRWTDSNNFQFQKTVNKCVLAPELDYYTNGFDGESTTQEETAATQAEDVINVNCNRARNSSTIIGGTKGTVCARARPIACNQTGTSPNFTTIYGNEWLTADTDQRIILESQLPVSWAGSNLESQKTTLFSTLLDSATDFDRGLYIDVTGVSANQQLNIEVQWIVEYIPKSYALDTGRHPPIDINFPAIQAMVNDPASYPIVVKGNSFFSSLWHGIKSAAQGIGKLLKGTSSVAAMIPDPRAQAYAKFGGAGGELLTGGGLQSAFARVM